MNNSKQNWVCVYKTTRAFEADAVAGNLKNQDISAVIINKQDQSYLAFGYVEVHVPAEDQTRAEEIIQTLSNPS